MDESFYASLLEEGTSQSSTQNPIILAVIISRRTSTLSSNVSSGCVQIAVAARIPRKRLTYEDSVKYTLKYFSFLDDRRRFNNLDALLTSLSPIGVVHLSCTESAELSTKSSGNKLQQQKRAREISNLLNKVKSVINSRRDILPVGANGDSNVAHLVATLPRKITNVKTLSQSLDSTFSILLGEETSSRFLTYKNNTKLLDDVLTKQSLALLLHMEKIDSQLCDNAKEEYELSSGDLTSHLTMDRTAMECINLLPSNHMGISSVVLGGLQSNNSIFGVLNHCKTKMGSRMLEVWLRQPCVDLKTILYRQSAVRFMVEINSVGRDRLRDEGLGGLKGVDLDGLCTKLLAHKDRGNRIGTTKSLEILYKTYLFVDQQLPGLTEALGDLIDEEERDNEDFRQDNDGALRTAIEGLQQTITELSMSTQLVEKVLDFDAAPRDFFVKSSFSEELQDIREELNSIEVELSQHHSEMKKIWCASSGNSSDQVRLEASDSGGKVGAGGNSKELSCAWQFRIPDTNATKDLQTGKLQQLVTVHRLLKNGVYFSTKELRQLGQRKHDLLEEYYKHQRQIVQNAMDVAMSYVPVLERASEIISELDVLASLAHVAAFSPHGYCQPEITDSDCDGFGIELQNARHPCVELQDNVDFIPNDFNLVNGISSFLLVTGPNMGGKSTYIRSLGAIVIMAQIGSYVPCTRAKINIVHNILSRVGAGDVQNRGISTFMAEMLEASSILRTATKRSLIIIDELGRGTSTFDGFGLATAISEYIVQHIGCITVFATHFHELTALAEKEKVVNNCHVTAQPANDGSNSLSFLYEVRSGPCLESFGIQVAEMANCPTTVIMDAKRKARELENFDGRKKRAKDSRISEHDKNVKLLHDFKSLPIKLFETAEEKWIAVKKLLV